MVPTGYLEKSTTMSARSAVPNWKLVWFNSGAGSRLPSLAMKVNVWFLPAADCR
ncbi:hypothetical protein D3C85_965670 [compost metagenome]